MFNFFKKEQEEKKENSEETKVSKVKSNYDYTVWINTDVFPDKLFYFEEFDVRKFLKAQNSFLMNYILDDGDLYSDWLLKECRNKNINPKLILANLQKEQSLISMKSFPGEKIMNRALGFGMTDAGDKKEYYGFKNQNISAINWLKEKFDYASSFYSKNKKLEIIVDNGLLKLTPLNAITYVSYLYTPWTGSPDSVFYKKWKTHGVYLLWKVWKLYWVEDLRKYYHIQGG